MSADTVFATEMTAPTPGPAPTGTVYFYDSHLGTLGTATLTGGQASLTVAFPVAQVDLIHVAYYGDSRYAAVASPNIDQAIYATGAGTASSSVTSSPGQPGGYSLLTYLLTMPCQPQFRNSAKLNVVVF